jgi:cytochrome c-type biogenesis protein CcmH/NrfG
MDQIIALFALLAFFATVIALLAINHRQEEVAKAATAILSKLVKALPPRTQKRKDQK